MTLQPPMPPARRVSVGDIELSVHEAGPPDGPVVLLCHGWPELAHTWRRQIAPLAAAGYRVIAPDQRGFGASDAPADPALYTMDHLVADLAGLLDALDVETAVYVGHDWGGIVVWHAAMLTPDRVAGVIGVNTPHLPRGDRDPIEVFRGLYGDDHYIVRFQELGVEAAFAGREDAFFEFMLVTPVPAEDLAKIPPSFSHFFKRFERFTGRAPENIVVPPQDRAVFARGYRQSGFHGGVNWYRNFSHNWRRMADVDHHIPGPALLIMAECDLMLPPKLAKHSKALVADLEVRVFEGCGHWTQWERSQELTDEMLTWLAARFPADRR